MFMNANDMGITCYCSKNDLYLRNCLVKAIRRSSKVFLNDPRLDFAQKLGGPFAGWHKNADWKDMPDLFLDTLISDLRTSLADNTHFPLLHWLLAMARAHLGVMHSDVDIVLKEARKWADICPGESVALLWMQSLEVAGAWSKGESFKEKSIFSKGILVWDNLPLLTFQNSDFSLPLVKAAYRAPEMVLHAKMTAEAIRVGQAIQVQHAYLHKPITVKGLDNRDVSPWEAGKPLTFVLRVNLNPEGERVLFSAQVTD